MIKEIKIDNKIIKIPNLNFNCDNTTKNIAKFICVAGENGSGKTTLIKTFENYAKSNNSVKNQNIVFSDKNVCFNKTNTIFIKHNDINRPIKKPNDNSTIDIETIVDPKIIYKNNAAEKTIDGQTYPGDVLTEQQIANGLIYINRITNDEFTKVNSKLENVNGIEAYNSLPISKFQNVINENLSTNFKFEVNNEHWFSMSNSFYDISSISTGEQQLLLIATKIFIQLHLFKNKNYLDNNTIYIFIDEIEAYLHPRWQFKILYFLKQIIEIFTNKYQLFFTTHSREIIDSALTNESILNDLIILYFSRNPNNTDIGVEKFNKNNLLLGGIAEINYKIFHIPSIEYYLMLYENKKGSISSYKDFDSKLMIFCTKTIMSESENQTYLTRIRHLIAHGTAKNEKGYVWFISNKDKCNSVTINFYSEWYGPKKYQLLKEAINELENIKI